MYRTIVFLLSLALVVAPAAGWAEPIVDRIERELGASGPVVLRVTEEGVTAASFDGAKTSVVLEGAVKWAGMDGCRGLLFYSRLTKKGQVLSVVDLRADTVAPLEIVRRIPSDADLTLLLPGKVSLSSGGIRGAAIELHLDGKRPKLTVELGIMGYTDEEGSKDFTRAARKASLTSRGTKMLKKVSKRPALCKDTSPTVKNLPHVAKVPANQCEDEGTCGAATTVPGTPHWTVTTEQSCGDGCYTSQQFYSPRSRVFFDPKTGKKSPSPLPEYSQENFVVSADGRGFVECSNKCAVVSFEKGVLQSWDGSSAGWLKGGWDVSF